MAAYEKIIDNCHSLMQLLKEYEVRIPIIQRDYVQGRENDKATAIRKRLIDDFVSCLENPDKPIDFNFIYGNTEGDIFYPVDGQQRLTSLYLLHWVLACRNEKIGEFSYLKPFTYATRNSANEFFSLMRKPNIELINLAKGTGFRKKIKDYPWFSAEWDNDPTVLSVLTFIDDLCDALADKDCATYYTQLISDDSAVRFTMLQENSGGNSETAAAIKYIRMNARGKELTIFENVKAMLDSVAEKLYISPNISEAYDKIHIDVFYEMARVALEGILQMNRNLDDMSLAFFKNIYNMVNLVEGKKSIFLNDMSYMNEMYEVSQQNVANKKLLTYYFEMLDRVLIACKNVSVRERLKSVFTQRFAPDTNKNEVACMLYLYHLMSGITDINVTDISRLNEKMDKLLYILNNLSFINWNEQGYTVANRLIKAIAEYDDVFSYFAENVFDVDDESLLNDIRIRLKEQHIKAKVIADLQVAYDYFNELEERSGCRKIQYLLIISDLWTDNDTDIILSKERELCKYKSKAEIYFRSNYLEWRKRFAVAGCMKKDVLLDCDAINKIDWQINCKWDDEYYFWDDETHPNIQKLTTLKYAYDYEDKYEMSKKIMADNAYDDCWLRYAVLRDYMVLLEKPIFYNQDIHRVYIVLDDFYPPRKRDFMAQVLILDLCKEGFRETSMKRVDITGCDNQCYYGALEFCTTKWKTHTFYSGKTYQHSNENLKFSDWRNYNLTICGMIPIIIEMMPKEVLVSTYNSNNKEFCLYVSKTPKVFLKFTYNLNGAVADVIEEVKRCREEFDKMGEDEFIEIYYNKRPEWKHDGGNSHSWNRQKEIVVMLQANQTNHIIN